MGEASLLLRRAVAMTELRRPRETLLTRLLTSLSVKIDRKIGWERLPLILGLPLLIGQRVLLRQRNLHDTGGVTKESQPPLADGRERYLTARTPDGTYNDLDYPTMGSVGARFGRNVPVEGTRPEREAGLLSPNPRLISRELLARDSFKPATTLNLMAAAWLQFMVHDWMSHGKNEPDNPWLVDIAPGDDWPEPSMRILRTRKDDSRSPGEDGLPATFQNEETHWWDGSQIYGTDKETQNRVRSGADGKLNIGSDGLLPANPEKGIDITGVSGNWWVGLSLLHSLFTLEHNAICNRLKGEYPSWSDDDLFDHARLINAALMAKIHTVEWTPAIIAHPTTRFALRSNWWGLQGERLSRVFGRLSDNDIISGIPGSPPDHYGAPYCLTEEFVTVYRMHPLLPDEINFRSVADDRSLVTLGFEDVSFRNGRKPFEHVSLVDGHYTFGTSHPGAITLHNFPSFLRRFTEPGSEDVLNDLAAIDIMRSRERGVPRYNDFRRLLHKPPVTTFDELTNNPLWADEIRRVYDGDIERVDTTVGLFAEPLPQGFGFSDTAFRIFILMASRRLKSDRFFTTDYNPRVYTQPGMEWIRDTDMSTVLLRHFPQLGSALRGVENAFAPWNRPMDEQAVRGPRR
jgi:Animal haem peroxidase